MTTRLVKVGRPPKTRDALYAAILDRPGEGLSSARLAEIIGCTSTAACDNLRVLRARGFVTWLNLDRVQLHFAPGPYKDLYAQAHQAGLSDDERTLHGCMEQRRARVIEMLGAGLPLGLSAMELAGELGVQSGSMRHLLRSMVQAGEVFAGGDARHVRWFGSREAKDAAKPALAAMEATRKAEVKAVLTEGRKTAAAAKKARAKTAKPRAMRRDCGAPLVRCTPKPVQERKPVEIIGLAEAEARKTEAVTYPPHRFWVDPKTHKGKFGNLRIGEYLTADEA